MTKIHQTTKLNGRILRYFDAYGSNHLAAFDQAQREGRLCVAVGPTGCGKTVFYDFAAAKYLFQDAINLCGWGLDDTFADRVVTCASSLGPNRGISIAFYPKPDTWPNTKATIDAVLTRLEERGLLHYLVGIEISVESDFPDILDAIRSMAVHRKWCLLEFPEWIDSAIRSYVDFLLGVNGTT